MRLGLYFLLLFSCSVGQWASAQEKDSPTKTKRYQKTLKLTTENGAILSNGSKAGDALVDASYYSGADLRLGFRKTDPNDIYSIVYRRPTLGVGYYTSVFRNDDIGTPTALYFFLDMPFKMQEAEAWNFSYTAAFGISYNFNPFDSIGNPANVLIGSYRNCYVHLGFSASFDINDKWALNGTVGFKHFSNGSFRKPNSGLNLLPVSVGATYTFDQQQVQEYSAPLPTYQRHNLFNITMYAGSKNYEIGGNNYLKTGWGFNYLRQINYRYRVGVGLDVYYSDGAEDRFESGENGFSESMSFALVGSWEWAITERLYAPIGIAFYLHRNPENDERTPYYERVGLRYRFNDHICGGVTIKAHGGVADIFEWTMAYTFHNDPNFGRRKK